MFFFFFFFLLRFVANLSIYFYEKTKKKKEDAVNKRFFFVWIHFIFLKRRGKKKLNSFFFINFIQNGEKLMIRSFTSRVMFLMIIRSFSKPLRKQPPMCHPPPILPTVAFNKEVRHENVVNHLGQRVSLNSIKKKRERHPLLLKRSVDGDLNRRVENVMMERHENVEGLVGGAVVIVMRQMQFLPKLRRIFRVETHMNQGKD